MRGVIFRAVVFELEEDGRGIATVKAGLGEWLGTGERIRVLLKVNRVKRVGLLVQRIGSSQAELIWSPRILIGALLGRRICRYHEEEGGEPLYCTREAVTADGYCLLHRNSWKALYERCAQGVDEACEEVADAKGFTVYALDYGGDRLKIGLTQSWRFVSRVAEQPHVAAVPLVEATLTEARALERELGKLKGATEGGGIPLLKRYELSAQVLDSYEVSREAVRLADMLSSIGVHGSFEAYTILPRVVKPKFFTEVMISGGAAQLRRREFELVDYWSGLLLLGDGRKAVALHKRELLHRVLIADVK